MATGSKSTKAGKPAANARKPATRAAKPASKPKPKKKTVGKKIAAELHLADLKKQLEKVLGKGEEAVDSLWHQTASAALHWISSHPDRVEAFQKSVRKTKLERPVQNALKTIRAGAKSKKRAAAAEAASKPVKKSSAKGKKTSRSPAKKTSRSPAKKTTTAAAK